MTRKQLSDAQNERVRLLVRQTLVKHNLDQKALAPKLGVTQGQISGFLGGRQGTTFPFVVKLAKFLGISEWEVLGSAPSTPQKSREEEATRLAKEAGISMGAIGAVLADVAANPEKRAGWPTLWIAVEMMRRETELLIPPTPGGPAKLPRQPKVIEGEFEPDERDAPAPPPARSKKLSSSPAKRPRG